MAKPDEKRMGNAKRRPRTSLRILVVEDHADTRRGLQIFLNAVGYEAHFAGSIGEALSAAAASDEAFDVLLSDLRLPDGSGWELLQRLRESGREPRRAVALSGWGSDNDLAKSQSAGFHVHLVKPPAPEALEAALRDAADAVQAQKTGSHGGASAERT